MWYKVKRIMMRPNGIEKQVYPKTRNPWANTIAYYPLENDVNDHSWNWYNLTPTNITYTTLSSWLKVATFNWSSSKATTSSFSTYSWNFTTSMWFYWNNITSQLAVMRCNAASDSSWKIRDIHIGAPNRIRAIMNWGSVETGTNAFTNNTWHHMVVTKEWSTWKLYINNSLKSTATVSYNTNTNMALWYRQFGNDRYWKWYISKFILENKVRTSQEISDYYNLTKSKYWL